MPSPSPRLSRLSLALGALVLCGVVMPPSRTEAHPPAYGAYHHPHAREYTRSSATASFEGERTSLPISTKVVYGRRGRPVLYWADGTYYRRILRNQQTVYIPVAGPGAAAARARRNASTAAVPFDAASHRRQYQSAVVIQRIPATRTQPETIIIIVPVEDSSGTAREETLLVSAP